VKSGREEVLRRNLTEPAIGDAFVEHDVLRLTNAVRIGRRWRRWVIPTEHGGVKGLDSGEVGSRNLNPSDAADLT
jgi:hypothetical protein